MHDSTVSASAKARPTEGATLHARLRLGYGQHQAMAQESVDDWYSIRPSTELGENLDGARRLSRLAQFSSFTHKPRRPGDYRLHHVTTSRTHSVLQRPQQASATRGLLVVTGCAAVSFTKKAWQCAQNEPHLPVQSLWELKPDLSEIRGASNYWHVQTKPPPRWCLSCCV